MIEAYAFLAAFAVQILALSVVNPARLITYVRRWADDFGSDRFAQQYPGVDYSQSIERFVTGYRAANIVIALLGLLVLGWLFTLTGHPDWVSKVINSTLMYFFLQLSPLALTSLYAVVRYHKVLFRPPQEIKRKATLQRRGLFDFVPRFAVFFAALSYLLFIPFAILVDLYVYDNTSLSKYCYRAIASVTLVYALNAFIIYKSLYGKKNPLVTHEGRVRMIGMSVKSGVYGCITVVWFLVLMSFVTKLELENWRPVAVSVFMVFSTLLGFMGLTAPPRKAEEVSS